MDSAHQPNTSKLTETSQVALKNFEVENNVVETKEELFAYSNSEQQAILDRKPWRSDPRYFTDAKISAKALIKMVTHTRSGGNIEVMGIMMGKVVDRSMVVIDAFALPVEGTETRVNAQAEGNEYMIEYLTQIREVDRHENAIGWYHSHPGYGCWLSGIDVSTQKLNQQFMEPFLAVVIDPIRSASAGRVDIGAFRTYPEGYTPSDLKGGSSEFQPIPVEKIEDFGVHAGQYYPLSVSFFKSILDTMTIDRLWDKYWVNTLSQSALFSNRDFFTRQLEDVQLKIGLAENKLRSNTSTYHAPTGSLSNRCPGEFYFAGHESDLYNNDDGEGGNKSLVGVHSTAFSKVAKQGCKATCEATHAVMAEMLKQVLFGGPSNQPQ